MQFVVKVVCTIIQVAIYTKAKSNVYVTLAGYLFMQTQSLARLTDTFVRREHTKYTLAYTLIILSFYTKIDLTPT